MNYLAQLQRSVDFIEANLDDELSIGDVARAAGISRWHYQRIFRSMTGETVKAYIRARRLARSLHRLRHTELRVLDIAIMAGFGSQEAFARAFKKAFGVTPSHYRARGGGPLVEKTRFDEAYLRHVASQEAAREPKLVRCEARTFVGMRTTFLGPDSERNNIAERLPPLWDAFMARAGEVPGRVPHVCWGIVEQPDPEEDELSYVAVVEVQGEVVVPEGMVRVDLPAALYAHFEHRGPSAKLDHTVSYIYGAWLLSSGHRHTYGPDLERYGLDYDATSPDSVIGYTIPVTEV